MISVITPVYNGVDFIRGCIQNVIDQSCSEAEHVIVDGGSSDGTLDVIRRYAHRYPHIRWISEKDHGQSDAMNKGITLAQGEIVGFLNVDDFYEPGVLNKVVMIFKDLPQPALLVGNCNIWDSYGNLLSVNKPGKLRFEDLILGPSINPFPVNPSAYFYHKALHEKAGFYDVNEHYALDLDFLLRAVRVAVPYYKDETWGNYRRLKGTKSITDVENGKAALRLEGVLHKYWEQMPPRKRIWLAIQYALRSRLIVGVIYYLCNPQTLPVLRKRLGRMVGMREHDER